MGKSGGSPSLWQYFNQVHQILGTYKSINYKEQMDESAEHWVVDDPDSWPVECLYIETEELVIPQVPENQPISSSSTAQLPSSTYSTSPSSPSSSMPPSTASVDKSLSPVIWQDQAQLKRTKQTPTFWKLYKRTNK
ncbi:PREDICTED: uncharacterized protein LOC108361406 [Rhagoletis zephyria]|uniref:uncharacterized protein LOC108361406 n=1 Tax=Rhagoletis zephyria TaxID=28612 RepID=UPI0008113C09|nr:PREDICTED: uncharacterized protein LOC108361406 [Rhagoletis zephyria]